MPAAALFALIMAPAVSLAQPSTSLPEWMAGKWVRWSGRVWTEESWSVRGIRMLGVVREGEWERTDMRKTLVIERTGRGLTLLAQPSNTTMQFAMVSQGASSIEFANPWQDFPQRITYLRRGPELQIRMSMLDGSRLVIWDYQQKGPFDYQ